MTVQSVNPREIGRGISNSMLSLLGTFATLVFALIFGLVPLAFHEDEVRVTRDYLVTQHHQALSAMVAAGRYDFVNPGVIPQNFKVESASVASVRVELIPVVSLGKTATVAEAVAELKSRGYRPATIAELLALGEQYPKAQAGATIVAPGSIWSTGSHTAVASLTGYVDSRGNTQRILEVFGAGVLGFRTNVVFAAVKN